MSTNASIIVYKNRTNIITVNLGMDITDADITSEIRTQQSVDAPLIAEWTVNVEDAETGEITLTLDNGLVSDISQRTGYMDIKRVVDDEPYPVFAEPLEVEFRGVVTA